MRQEDEGGNCQDGPRNDKIIGEKRVAVPAGDVKSTRNRATHNRRPVMNYTEKHHAFISAKYYQLLKARNFPTWQDAFLYATRRYGEQRGGRMAQRAIRDGKPLTIGTYCSYGEWNYTDEATAENFPQSIHDRFEGDNMIRTYEACPWNAQYMAMDCKDGAILYCQDLDMSIARGFNPAIQYDVTQTMHEHGTCIHIMGNLANDKPTAKKPENVRDFRFHCAHAYWVYADVLKSIYKTEGELIAAEVLRAFAEEYGQDMADGLMEYKDTNFDYI